MSEKKVSILVPNYKTLEVTTICMRLLRKYTNHKLCDVLVIDNDSQDASTEYLRSLDWITLIERKAEAGESGPEAHSRALDLALAQVNTPFVLSIHTDTFIKRSDWIEVLLAQFLDHQVAGVGSWKLEYKSPIRRAGIQFEQGWKFLLHKLFGYSRYKPDRLNKKARYLRSHCAMYRTDVIRELGTHFGDGDATAGMTMHRKMIDAGYKMIFLETEFLGDYVDHLNHATGLLTDFSHGHAAKRRKLQKQLQSKLRGIDASRILADSSLDR